MFTSRIAAFMAGLLLAGACGVSVAQESESLLKRYREYGSNGRLVEAAIKIVREGARADAVYQDYRMLDLAVDEGSEELLRLLLEKGANPGAMDLDGDGEVEIPPLLRLLNSRPGNAARLVALLLQAGASPDAEPPYPPPLLEAASHGLVDIVDILLAAGASPDGHPNYEPPASAAASAESLEILELLMVKGVSGRSLSAALESAAMVGNKPLFDHLITHEAKADPGALLLVAALGNNPEIVREVLRLAPDVEQPDGLFTLVGGSRREQDASRRTIEIYRILRARGMRPKAGELDAPLLVAILDSNATLVDALLELGASLDARSYAGSTPLMLLAQDPRGTISLAFGGWRAELDQQDAIAGRMAVSLLNKGADINAVDDTSQTALHKAVAAHSELLVRMFLDRGADKHLVDKMGETPLALARRVRPTVPPAASLDTIGALHRETRAALVRELEFAHELLSRSEQIIELLEQ